MGGSGWSRHVREQRGPEAREMGGPVCLVGVENRRKRKFFPLKGEPSCCWRGDWQGREGAGRLSRGSRSKILLQD